MIIRPSSTVTDLVSAAAQATRLLNFEDGARF
jgi:hypothetical protein